MTQRLVPNSDISADLGWTSTGASFFTEVDETIQANDGNTTYIRSGTDSEFVMMGLTSGVDPGVDTDHKIRARFRYESGSSVFISFYISQGGSAIVSGQFPGDAGSTLFFTQEYTLSEGEVALITDYSDLEFRFGFQEAPGTFIRITAVEFAMPDAPATMGPIFQRHPSQRALLRR